MIARFSLPFIIIVMIGLLSACGKSDEVSNKKTTVKESKPAQMLNVNIGFSAPLTGPQAHLGLDMKHAAQMAIEEINASKPEIDHRPTQFHLVVEDDKADPYTANTVAQKLVGLGVKGVIGHMNSGVTIQAAKIYNSNNLVQISPASTAVKYTAGNERNVFRVIANDSHQGKALGVYASKELKAKSIAIVNDGTVYGQGLAGEFEKAVKTAGTVIVAHELFNDKTTDFTAILNAIKSKKPDLLFFAGTDMQAALLAHQIHEMKLEMPLLGGDAIRSGEFIKSAGGDAEGVTASLPGIDFDHTEAGMSFRKKFEAHFGAIQLYAPYTYDAVKMMVVSMIKARSVETALYLPILATSHYEGVTGEIYFDPKGDVQNKSISFYKVVNGKWQFVKTLGGKAGSSYDSRPVETDPFYTPNISGSSKPASPNTP